jgi:hypothetical protein
MLRALTSAIPRHQTHQVKPGVPDRLMELVLVQVRPLLEQLPTKECQVFHPVC